MAETQEVLLMTLTFDLFGNVIEIPMITVHKSVKRSKVHMLKDDKKDGYSTKQPFMCDLYPAKSKGFRYATDWTRITCKDCLTQQPGYVVPQSLWKRLRGWF